MRTIVDAAKAAGISAVIAADGCDELRPADRTGGASVHATEYFECGGFAFLCPICRCGGAGARN